jgi:uncharacterized caspase-like protein
LDGISDKDIRNSGELLVRLNDQLQSVIVKLSKVTLSIKINGSQKESQAFLDALSSTLIDNGFTVTDRDPAIKIIGEISLRKSGLLMKNFVYYAEGNITALRTLDRQKIAVYPLSVKGIHPSETQAVLEALSGAGIEAGNELAKLILDNEKVESTMVLNNIVGEDVTWKKGIQGKDTTPPEIIITSHETRGIEIVQKEELTTITGIVKDESEIVSLTVNHKRVKVNGDGVFKTKVDLKQGRNQIVVSATDIYGNKAHETFTIIGEFPPDTTPQVKYAPYEKEDHFTSHGKYYALIIGNNNYKYLPRLKTAQNDAQEVARILKQKYGFITKLLFDTSRSDISHTLNSYTKTLTENDNFLIYYAGHGIFDETANKAYWLPVDAGSDDDTNWIIVDDITTKIKRITSKHVLIIADSCFSGTMTRGISINVGSNRYLQKMLKKSSRTLLASGGNEPVSDVGGGGHSVFAEALIRGLLDMEPKVFTAEQLYYEYIKERVAGSAEQTPEYSVIRNSGHEGGDFVFRKVH